MNNIYYYSRYINISFDKNIKIYVKCNIDLLLNMTNIIINNHKYSISKKLRKNNMIHSNYDSTKRGKSI